MASESFPTYYWKLLHWMHAYCCPGNKLCNVQFTKTILFTLRTNITVLWVIGTPLVPTKEPEVSRVLESVSTSWCRLSHLGKQWWCWRWHEQLSVMEVICEQIQVFIHPVALSQIYLVVSKMAERILQLGISRLHGNLFPM